jgi:hypothetical protein
MPPPFLAKDLHENLRVKSVMVERATSGSGTRGRDVKEGRKEGMSRKEGRKRNVKEGRKKYQGRKEGRKECQGRKEGGNDQPCTMPFLPSSPPPLSYLPHAGGCLQNLWTDSRLWF